MLLTDTHCHLYSAEFAEDRTEVIQRAFDAGVHRIFLPNIDLESVAGMQALVSEFPGKCFPAMGLHPCYVGPGYQEVLQTMRKELDTGKYAAVGEIGIDLYWDTTYKKEQELVFETQIEWAKELNLPIIVHVRNSFDETLAVVDRLNDERLSGIFHCFTGTIEQARHILDYGGFKLGIGGVVTFKNSGLDKVVSQLSLNDLVLETDAPYLAPAPLRGKRNEPAYTLNVAQKLAEIFGTTVNEVAAVTTKNSIDIFGC